MILGLLVTLSIASYRVPRPRLHLWLSRKGQASDSYIMPLTQDKQFRDLLLTANTRRVPTGCRPRASHKRLRLAKPDTKSIVKLNLLAECCIVAHWIELLELRIGCVARGARCLRSPYFGSLEPFVSPSHTGIKCDDTIFVDLLLMHALAFYARSSARTLEPQRVVRKSTECCPSVPSTPNECMKTQISASPSDFRRPAGSRFRWSQHRRCESERARNDAFIARLSNPVLLEEPRRLSAESMVASRGAKYGIGTSGGPSAGGVMGGLLVATLGVGGFAGARVVF
mgnify:CR=1 FL=1